MSTDADTTLRDSGLQPERTALSWRRTLLAMLVIDVLLWRSWFVHRGPELAGVASAGVVDLRALAAAVAALATVLVAAITWHRSIALGKPLQAPPALLLAAIVGAVALTALAAAAAIVWGN
ncbi:DUF202 domain-containing protein [Pseudarthrobacter sp. J1738]|uniref:DUF202 domain-containing protein n=1 Tax=unclassified Pseudarthrobacter TaxID=2647000 RepID=UPI003D278378